MTPSAVPYCIGHINFTDVENTPMSHYYKIFITAGSKPLITVGLGPSAVKVVGDKNGYHHRWLGINAGSC
jgi:hypothetical protein